ncbi:CelD/BcsL family acetyltransferase involved in cellulose biosynthesis [Sphingobium sp. OAS761]|uniref:GNAT family N-acetyltransferase n=1 Tax=Sphingobium sp. OAS761 TaxID=2817901 RepID=UPI0020A16830|nr:GNAT family N-acetyltransferase [Sphingobium sp. OAS761]MCP1468348.1 CelD/BcsL family acetyltransferase involved in cellulose biosynthesis [Sphingobium sp. OAS761]
MDMASHPTSPAPGAPARSRWAQLARDAAEANAFYAPDMLGAALDHLANGTTIRMVEAHAGGSLIGVLPIILQPRHGRLPLACTANWMHDHCFFGAPIVQRGSEIAAWRDFLAQLDAAPWARGFLHLESIDAAGANAAAIEALCVEQRRGWREIHRYDRAMLRSDLDADQYWETHVRAKKRKELRRLQKRLADMGTVETRLLADRTELARWCGDFLALEASGWKGRQGTALSCKPSDAAFFRAACASALDHGRLHFLRLDLDGRAIAMLVNFRHGNGAFSFKIAIDEELGRFSPGVLIEIANLHAVQSDPAIGWMDSCAAPDHPMIDSLWAERRSIVQYRIALRGSGMVRLRRAAAFHAANGIEALASLLKGQG